MAARIVQSAVCKTNRFFRPSPSLFYFPGLNTAPIWSGEAFAEITEKLQSNYEVILKEYQSLLHNNVNSDYSSNEEHKLHIGTWEWYSLILKGVHQGQGGFVQHCPKTTALLQSFQNPHLMTSTPFSYTFFSKLHGKTVISSHTSPCNLRIRCHFPLIVPKAHCLEDCGMRVADRIFPWKIGEPIFFDDSYEHEGETYWQRVDYCGAMKR